MKRLLLSVCILLLVTISSSAQETVEEIRLTDASVKQWAKAFSELQDWSRKMQEKYAGKSDEELTEDYYRKAFGEMQEHAEQYAKDVEKIVNRNGFDSTEEWSAHGEQIMATFSVILLNEQKSTMGDSMTGILKQMEAAGMPEEQLKEARRQIEEAQSQLNEEYGEISERDVAIVRDNFELLKKAMEYPEDSN